LLKQLGDRYAFLRAEHPEVIGVQLGAGNSGRAWRPSPEHVSRLTYPVAGRAGVGRVEF
jgi:hypothetical protein